MAVDTELLKTFLEVSRTRHFGQAAENLFLTQSAVSARIRLLEEAIGAPLFTRTRNNIQLTPTGQRLLRHAESIVNAWNRARQEVSVQEEARSLLAIGGVPILWDTLLQEWIHTLYRKAPDIALTAEVHASDVLLRRLRDGTLDVAFMFEPPQVAELAFNEIANVRLVMISSRASQTGIEAVRDGYVFVDWGTSFAIAHANHFPDMPSPAFRTSLGRLAHAFIRDCGGAAYLAEAMVSDDIRAGRLFVVDDAPVINRVAYTVYPANSDRAEILKRALSYFPNVPTTGAATD
jgi:LysR family transcriptional regulator, flagellar master operon regulator